MSHQAVHIILSHRDANILLSRRFVIHPLDLGGSFPPVKQQTHAVTIQQQVTMGRMSVQHREVQCRSGNDFTKCSHLLCVSEIFLGGKRPLHTFQSNPTQSDLRFEGGGLLPHCPISSSDHVSTVVIAVSFSMAPFMSKFQKTGLALTTLSLLQNPPPPPRKRILVEKVVKGKEKIYPFSIIERTGR
jgi:hypothetical protein